MKTDLCQSLYPGGTETWEYIVFEEALIRMAEGSKLVKHNLIDAFMPVPVGQSNCWLPIFFYHNDYYFD